MEARRRPLVGAIGPAVGGGAAAAPSLMQALFGRVPLTACVRTGFFVVGALGFIRLMWALLFIRHSSGAQWPHCCRYPLTNPQCFRRPPSPGASSFGFPHPKRL